MATRFFSVTAQMSSCMVERAETAVMARTVTRPSWPKAWKAAAVGYRVAVGAEGHDDGG